MGVCFLLRHDFKRVYAECSPLFQQIKLINSLKCDANEVDSKDILKVKFRNTTLAKFLKDTGTKHLAEAGKDNSWATGIPLYNKSAFDKKKWSGKNLLGKILMEVRAELSD